MKLGLIPIALVLGNVFAFAQGDSAGYSRPARGPRTMIVGVTECPMPVLATDPAKSERMPVARVNPARWAIRQVAPGCLNPLGPTPGPSAGRAAPTP